LLLRGIAEKILTLPGATEVLPGHGPSTTVATEKATNPFLQR
jgi:glyoxylase-like metal-dependent hydrolase (beta-lactamase superfamily II)